MAPAFPASRLPPVASAATLNAASWNLMPSTVTALRSLADVSLPPPVARCGGRAPEERADREGRDSQ